MEYFCKPNPSTRETDLVWILNSPSMLKPGDTVWVDTGVYKPRCESIIMSPNVKGTPAAPITIRNMPNKRANIVFSLGLTGDYIRIQGLWITGDCANGISVMGGTGHEIINNVIWGISKWPMGCGVQTDGHEGDLLLYGNIVFNNGRRQGQHGFYLRNYDKTKPTRIVDNIFFENADIAMALYCEKYDVEGYHVEGNISFAPYGVHLIMQGANKARYSSVIDNFFVCPAGTRQPRWPVKVNPGSSIEDVPIGLDVHGNYCIGSYDRALMVCNFDKMGYPVNDRTGEYPDNVVISQGKVPPEIVYIRKNKYLPRYHVAICNPEHKKLSIPTDFPVGAKYRVCNVLGWETEMVYPDNGVVGADQRVVIEQNYDKHNFKSSMGRFDYEPDFGCYIVEIDE